MFGLTVEEATAPEEVVEVFPDNVQPVSFFLALGDGSWNIGFSGPTGFRREAFREVRFALGIKAAEYPDVFAAVVEMEGAALAAMRKDKDK